jgi:pilus assembly protein CpaF
VSATAGDPGVLARVRAGLVHRGSDRPGDVAHLLSGEGVRRDLLGALDEVTAELTGAGPLQPLLDDPAVTDVLVNAPDEVWVDAGTGLRRVDLDLGPPERLRALAVRLAARSGRRLDDAAPYVDARLPGGVRLHAVLAPLAVDGTVLSLRVPPRRGFTLPELVGLGGVPPGWDAVLAAVVRRRLGFLVSGGTGTGKTTLLSALLGEVDPAERVVTVEDTAELRPACPHHVRLESRPANAEGSGAVPLAELVRQALRMRPDRVVVGECRGAEVLDLLTALNTGHAGGCGTVHANAAEHVPSRLEALGMLGGVGRAALARQVASALDVVVHLERREGLRRVVGVGVVVDRGEHVEVEAALVAMSAPGSPGARGRGWPRLAALLGDDDPWAGR